MNGHTPRHFILSQQVNPFWLLKILFPLAQEMADLLNIKNEANQAKLLAIRKKMLGKGILTVFWQASTRTRFSFELAAKKIGLDVFAHTESAGLFSSSVKGETLADTIHVIGSYCLPHADHAIVMRHDKTGAALEAAKISPVTIVNAGDGTGQHPTQALLDAFTIWQKFHRLDNLTVAMVGDLTHGRTVRSLSYLLSKFPGVNLFFVSPENLKIGADITEHLRENRVAFSEIDSLKEVVGQADVVYTTRIQREWPDAKKVIYDPDNFRITPQILNLLKENAIVMHPLPRNPVDNELPTEVDGHPSARYFSQAQNGLFVRMALLYLIFSEATPEMPFPIPLLPEKY
ncbi:MAG: aspartate carbamoyltransferase [Patescibacteria group bacterium]|jgi:aspartate carbamoyltransferase catalytic subunit